MIEIRPLERDDVPAVARLFASTWRSGEGDADPELERFLTSSLLDHPWFDRELPSHVATDDGRVVGFVGSNVRRVLFDGEPIRMVCSAHFMVDPSARRLALGARLMKGLFDGPQDITITDGATDAVRRMWEGLGGDSVPLGALMFVRLFRPTSLAADLALARAGRGLAATRGRPLAGGIDRVLAAAVGRLAPAPATGTAVPLTPSLLVERADEILQPTRLRLDYDLPFTTWLFDELARVEARGTLWSGGVGRGRLWAEAVEVDGRLKGWYVCHLREGGFCRMIQLAARPRDVATVFDQLCARAHERGAAAVYGRLEPRLVSTVTAVGALIRPSDGRLLVQSRDPRLSAVVRAGDAQLQRMDGEWW